MNDLDYFRRGKDEFFRGDPQSPLTQGQRKKFAGLNYFPENPALRLELDVEEFPEKEEGPIQTSTGDVQYFQRFGRIHFSVDGQAASLTLLRNENGFFLPFVDSLAGTETYPAGRYLEPELLGPRRLLIDFNYAYNPYCAYNPRWSCPLTPFENRLKVPIRAGEKLFHEE
jgi:uncharacterized protein (DUF1684 family)